MASYASILGSPRNTVIRCVVEVSMRSDDGILYYLSSGRCGEPVYGLEEFANQVSRCLIQEAGLRERYEVNNDATLCKEFCDYVRSLREMYPQKATELTDLVARNIENARAIPDKQNYHRHDNSSEQKMTKNVRLYFPEQKDVSVTVFISRPFTNPSPVTHAHGYWTFRTKDGMAVFDDGTTSEFLSFDTNAYGHYDINDKFARFFDGSDFASVARADLKSFEESHIAAFVDYWKSHFRVGVQYKLEWKVGPEGYGEDQLLTVMPRPNSILWAFMVFQEVDFDAARTSENGTERRDSLLRPGVGKVSENGLVVKAFGGFELTKKQ